jgi:hypothetical protein
MRPPVYDDCIDFQTREGKTAYDRCTILPHCEFGEDDHN